MNGGTHPGGEKDFQTVRGRASVSVDGESLTRRPRSLKSPTELAPSPAVTDADSLLRNHLTGTRAIDFSTVPTVTFDILYVFVVLSLERLLIVQVRRLRIAPRLG
jgi:hypothetical protein